MVGGDGSTAANYFIQIKTPLRISDKECMFAVPSMGEGPFHWPTLLRLYCEGEDHSEGLWLPILQHLLWVLVEVSMLETLVLHHDD